MILTKDITESNAGNLGNLARFGILFFPIASYFCYRYVGINDQILKFVYFITLPIILVAVFPEMFRRNPITLYSSIIRNIFCLIVISMICAYLFWDQDFSVSYRVTAVYLAICYFFLLQKHKPDLAFIEKVIWFLCIQYIVLWMFGIYKAPQLVFGLDRDGVVSNERGFYRLFIPGKTIIVLCYFLALNKFCTTGRYLWTIVAVALFTVIVMHVIRQVILITVVVSAFYLLSEKKIGWKIALVSLLCFWFGSGFFADDSGILGRLISISEEQIERNQIEEEDIRLQEYKYFFSEYSKNWLTVLIGNGFAHSEGPFGEMESKLAREKFFFGSDVGYAEIYIRLGIVGLICYCLIFFRAVRQRVPAPFVYAKLFIVYLAFANIAASWVFHDTIIICFCLYILERCFQEDLKEESYFLPLSLEVGTR
ncbi:hypothetical protein [Dyadobacter alkalitolerans]|uniref:hypothetical protein n=1 Tax=Dyadobacter alkalitolerans TaxID=492736 RepID=UPI0003FB8720|nr:hypothetical protein [Dyadobacter alkalitolerans]